MTTGRIENATKEELDKISIAWGRGQLFRQIQARQVQLTNQDELGKTQGTVKLTKKVKLKPYQTFVTLRPYVQRNFWHFSLFEGLRSCVPFMADGSTTLELSWQGLSW